MEGSEEKREREKDKGDGDKADGSRRVKGSY